LFIVPPVVVAIAKHPIVEKYDLSHVKGKHKKTNKHE